jgi:hypothetical protein
MKVEAENIVVERSETFTETPFRIKASPKAFKILSNSLYANKIRAIVRELGTNAADSHVAAGYSEAQFLVHLPNMMEPWFSIRDYGTGLSKDAIEHIYTTYFESNKTESNDFTGCLGLGSKSPFSYTDNFMVISYINGVKLTYTAIIAESGFPTIVMMNEEATTEPNGVEISFAVKPNDFNTFRYEAEKVYNYFKVQPKIVGKAVTFTKETFEYTGKNWGLTKDDENNNHYAIMGNVAYPISLSSAGAYHRVLDTFGLRVYANIGDIEMTASRESLEYTDRTKAFIKACVEEAAKKFQDEVLVRLQEQKTYWEACVFFRENQLWLGSFATWKTRKVASSITLNSPVVLDTYEHRSYRSKIRRELKQSYRALPIHNCVFVDNDLERGTFLRVRHFLNNNPNLKVYIFKFTDEEADKKKEFLDTLDLPANMLLKASTMERPVVEKKVRRSVKNSCYKLTNNTKNMMSCWELTEVDSTAKVYYVEMEQWNVKLNGKVMSPQSLVSMVAAINDVSNGEVEVYGVRPTMLKKVRGYAAWKPVETLVEETQQAYKHDFDLCMNMDSYEGNWPKVCQLFKNELPKLKSFFEKVEFVQKQSLYLHRLRNFYHMVNMSKEASKPTEIEFFKKNYPLAESIIKSVYSTREWPVEALKEYFKLVDEKLDK